MQLSNDPYYVEPEDLRLWQDVVNLLKHIQIDYQGTRQKLEQINLHIAEREALVDEQIQKALLSSRGYSTLRLIRYSIDSPLCRLGQSVLGGVNIPAKIQDPASIEVRFLGRFEVRSSDIQIEDWRSTKARSVFQYLLTKPHEPTLKEILLEALWPGSDAQTANNNLKAAIHSLRLSLSKILKNIEASQIILFTGGSYRISPQINLSIDISEFEKFRDNGRRLEKENRLEEAIRQYEKAEHLYRGDYLEDELYEDWTLIRRETLKGNYLIILTKLAEYYLAAGDFENCIHYSQKIITKDSSREDAYRNLINCYLHLNQRNRALRWYEICCQTIKSELDALPEKATIELGEKIMI
jgi:LuxR family transcriptional regulator, maltose regulon positive regulatory protein